jgi:hypothetical protein
MKTKLKCLLLFVTILIGFQLSSFSQTLNEKLKFLEPMLGNIWEGEMKSPDGTKSFKVTLSYEAIWNGEVIKFSRYNPELKYFTEGYIYWDDETSKVTFFSVSSRGGASMADITIEEGKITLKGQLTMRDKTFDYKNTFEFTPDGKMIDRWFQNAFGPWQSGHVIEFKRID